MRICVFGAGALGSAVGGILARGNEVSLIGRTRHVKAVSTRGLMMTGDIRRTSKPRAYFAVPKKDPPELLIIATKAYDTAQAISECRGWASKETAVLTLQNGLGNLELLEQWKGDKALGGTTTMGSTLVSPGHVRISGIGRTVIGSDRNPELARKVAHAFALSGLPASFSPDIGSEMWGKAVVSACINPLSAILRVPNGRLLESPVISQMMKEISLECEGTARAKGVRLPRSEMFPTVRSVARETSNNLSSMLQDVLRGRRTEIEQINGAFWRLSEEHGLDAPLNRTVTALVQSLESHGRRKVNMRT